MTTAAPNGNGKLTTVLGGLAIIVTLCGGAWKLIQDQVEHQKEIQAIYQNEVQRMEGRITLQKQELDTSLQREMRTLNAVIEKDVQGNDRLSLDRHNFQEQEIRELKERVQRLEGK